METNASVPAPLPAAAETRKKERSFELALPALIKGFDVAEREFEEQTEVTSLSSQEAVLSLRSKVMIGTKLLLSLRVPQTFFLEKRFDLCLSGTVAFVKADLSPTAKAQLVSVRLDRNFRVHA